MKSIYSFVLVFIIGSYNLFAQGPTNQTKVPQVIPPSPDVAALGKYGSIPVGLSSGIPDITIPIYTINQGSLQLPISLSYHASGIKVSEIASWTGLGWVLNAGGNVSRSVVGLADNNGFWVNTVKSHTQINWINDYLYLRGVADNTYDIESDFYFYNYNGRSGKFVYKQNQGNASPQLIPEAPIKIVYTSPGFQITDDSGTIYKFAAIENMTVDGTVIESASHLTEIVSADGVDHIYFSYISDNNYTEFNPTFTETVGQQCSQNVTGPPSNGYYVASGPVGAARDITSLRLAEITYSNGKVEFITAPRSDLPPKRLSEIKIHKKNPDGTHSPLKSFSLGEDYFIAPTGTGADRYRLKLSGVTEMDGAGVAVNGHKFKYEEEIKLPQRMSLAQDWWGYYNGKTGNTSLIASENVNFLGQGYVVGNADRNPNAATMQSGMLKSIIYPTSGYTEFDYEPHSYTGGTTTTSHNTSQASSGSPGNTTTLLQQTIPFTPTTSGWARVTTFCSNVTDAVPFFSTVTIKKQNDLQYLLNHKYDPAVYSPYNAELSKEFLVYLVGGHTYELTVMSKGTSTSTLMSGAAFSQAQVFWYQTTAGTSTMAGGLRVKEIRDYPSPGASPIVKLYRYGLSESGHGTLIMPPGGIGSSKQEVNFIYSYVYTPGGMFGTDCWEACRGQRLIINSRPSLDLTTLSGSPVAYEEVTVYQGSVSAPLGKQVSKFDVQVDQVIATDKSYNNGRYQINDSWRGGDEVLTTLFKGVSTKVKETATVNSVYKSNYTIGTKVGWRVNHEGCGEPHPIGFDTCCNTDLFYAFDYPMYSGVKKVTSVKETQFSTSTPAKFTTVQTDYEYDNLNGNHQQLSRKITLDSDGSKYENHYWYPADYLNIGEIIPLMTKNIISTPIKEEVHRNDQIISGKVTRLNSDGKPIEVHQYESLTPQTPPVHHGGTIVPAGYVKKLDISYHATGKQIIQTQPSNNHPTAYIWGYNGTYPTAMIMNASSASVAATSFESNDKGNWTYTGATLAGATSKTGSFHWRLGSGKNITKSITAGTYKLEYWAKGTVNLSGGTIIAIRTSAADANGWILYEKQVTMTATTTLTMSGANTAYLDEVRLYPITGQMTTYTYDIDKGITSVTDPNNVVTYYEYDAAGRLKLIKDNNRHVVKAYDYHYKGY